MNRVGIINRYIAFALPALLLAGCHRQASPNGQAGEAQQSRAGIPQTSSPGSSPASADAILAENDRIIAENQRMTTKLADYSHEDQTKLDRLSGDCRKTVGAPTDADSARRNFLCIQAKW